MGLNRSGGGGSRTLPNSSEDNLGGQGLSADFWLTQGVDGVTVQKSAEASEVEYPYSTYIKPEGHGSIGLLHTCL